MTRQELLVTPETARRLTERLNRLSSVSRFDVPGEPQAATLAHSFTDIEKSFREFLEILLPKLLDESSDPNQLHNTLLDIGEEFRHILYHIRDPKFFRYLIEDDGKH
jgi:hypothetical protein